VFLAAAGLLAMLFFMTLYLQRVLGYGPLQAGVSFLPFSGAMAIGSGAMAIGSGAGRRRAAWSDGRRIVRGPRLRRRRPARNAR
jgi:hypothetical protein